MFYRTQTLFLAVLFAVASTAFAAATDGAKSSSTSTAKTTYNTSELKKIAEPIALYPDVLVRQILPASTFPDQLVDAALFLEAKADVKTIPQQPWDESVKALANYPSVVMTLVGDPEWTAKLASAFLNQPQPLMNAIQVLRTQAKNAGNLKSSDGQTIVESKNDSGDTIIQIQPTDPQVVYVPTSTPTEVYTSYTPSYSSYVAPVATLGLGMLIGYAMNDDDDHYYYGGGGYYGPWGGNNMWDTREENFDRWTDYREDRWNDVNDNRRDRQDFRQDQWSDMSPAQRQNWANNAKTKWNDTGKQQAQQRQADRAAKKDNFKSSSPQDRQAWAQNQRNNLSGMTSEQRQQIGKNTASSWQSRAQSRGNSWSSMSSTERQNALNAQRSKYQSRSGSYGSSDARARLNERNSSYNRSSSSWGSSNRASAYSGMNSGSRSSSYSSRGSMSRSGSYGGYRGGGGGFRGGGGRGGGRR